MSDFEDNLNFGNMAENEIARWLMEAKGYSVLPVYELIMETGKGPRLFSLPKNLIAPDILAMKEKDCRWIESKRKTRFAWFRTGNTWNTGIDYRHYLDYLEVEQKTGIPVWLLFLHENSNPSKSDREWGCPLQCPTGLFGAPLAWLRQNEQPRNEYTKGYDRNGRSYPMVYWSYEVLNHIAPLDEIRGLTPA